MKVDVGDLLEFRLPEGHAYGSVVLQPAAYPPAISFLPRICADPLEEPSRHLLGEDTITALVPLPVDAAGRVRVLARGQVVPETRFQVPVRDRAGKVLYFWEWDGQRIEIGDATTSPRLPERRIVPIGKLARLLERPPGE